MEGIHNEEKELYWLWFDRYLAFSHSVKERLLEIFHTPEVLFHTTVSQLKNVLTEKQIQTFLQKRDMHDVVVMKEKLKEKDIRYIMWYQEEYPPQLLELTDYPYVLYLRGNASFLSRKSIAIIGARNASAQGKELAKYFARELAKQGIAIISGMAAGIDGAAHYGALDAGGMTIGVLGCGVNVIYPKEHANLYWQMCQQGAVISEVGIDTKPMAYLFPMRNRLISALSSGILVIEAKKQSGSLITVDQGLEQGKDIYAIPGNIYHPLSEGCNQLIKQGAKCVTHINDILEELHLPKQEDTILQNEIQLAPTEKIVYSCLGLETKYIDCIMNESGLTVAEVLSALYQLERKGFIQQEVRNYFHIRL